MEYIEKIQSLITSTAKYVDLKIVIASLVAFLFGIFMHYISVKNKIKEHADIKQKAITDPLTGKGNRHKFTLDMDEHVNKKSKFAICFMDLDGFKNVNDTLGHDAGDTLLIELSKMLTKNLPSTCESYRLGGDEFAIIIDKVNSIDEISKILDKLKIGLSTPINIQSTKIVLEYSLGVAIYPTDADNRSDLMTYADDAMYYIKENGKNSYYFHNEALKAQLDNKKKMEKDLKAALLNNEFDVEYQPRVDVLEPSKICFETLIYWVHPVLGKLEAKYFIKQAEEMGMVVYLDEFVLGRALDKLKSIIDSGMDNVSMAVNISNMHSKRHDFVNKICDIISSYELPKNKLKIEITDRIEPEKIAGYKYLIDSLKEIGIETVISNLDINCETLELFSSLSAHEIKLNARYVFRDKLINDRMNKDFIATLISLCKQMGYSVDIICIEKEQEINAAINSGADRIQGNYLFKKITEDHLDDFLKNYETLKNGVQIIVDKARQMNNI